VANKILVARGTKARIEEIKSTLATNELVYSTDTGELGVKKANGNIEYFMNAVDIDASKQDKLIAGDNISIVGNTISASVAWQDVENKPELYNKTEINSMLDDKVDKVSGMGLSSNDFTTTEKNKLSGIQAGAQVNAVTTVAGRTGAVVLTKADVGLGSVQNYAIASKTQAESGTSNVLYMTPLRTKELITVVMGDIESALDAILGK
jgi:hypothetical protein